MSDKPYAKVTRLEVIGDKGRLFSKWAIEVERLSYQDDGHTLKVFIRGDDDDEALPPAPDEPPVE